MPVATRQGYGVSEILADLDRAVTAAKEQGAEEFLIAMRWGNQELLEMVRSRLRASPLPVRLLPDRSIIRTLLGQRGGFTDALLLPVTIQRPALTSVESALKRTLDVVVSMTAIMFFRFRHKDRHKDRNRRVGEDRLDVR